MLEIGDLDRGVQIWTSLEVIGLEPLCALRSPDLGLMSVWRSMTRARAMRACATSSVSSRLCVKLDMESVRRIGDDPIRRSLVSGLAYLALETGCERTAEGIEADDERTALLELGVQLGQGFPLGRPQPSG